MTLSFGDPSHKNGRSTDESNEWHVEDTGKRPAFRSSSIEIPQTMPRQVPSKKRRFARTRIRHSAADHTRRPQLYMARNPACNRNLYRQRRIGKRQLIWYNFAPLSCEAMHVFLFLLFTTKCFLSFRIRLFSIRLLRRSHMRSSICRFQFLVWLSRLCKNATRTDEPILPELAIRKNDSGRA